jgi:hypothetical protein
LNRSSWRTGFVSHSTFGFWTVHAQYIICKLQPGGCTMILSCQPVLNRPAELKFWANATFQFQ